METSLANPLTPVANAINNIFSVQQAKWYFNNYNRNPPNTTALYGSTRHDRIAQIIIDWIVVIGLIAAYVCVQFLLPVRIRYYTCDMSDVSYPVLADTIPFWAVAIYGAAGPILFMLLVELFNVKLLPFQKDSRQTEPRQKCRYFLISFNHALVIFGLGLGMTLLITEVCKRVIGTLRPNFFQACNPSISTLNCWTLAATGYVYNSIYTGGSFCQNSGIDDSRMSFPSGHASYITYTMMYLILYLQARLFMSRWRFLKAGIQLTAVLTAFLTSATRISDHHHRVSELLVGALIGVVCAALVCFYAGRVLWEYNVKQNTFGDFDEIARQEQTLEKI